MSSCLFDGSPPLNTDIAGIGVRISTYVQAFLAIMITSVTSESDEILGQALTYVIMNISVITSALVLGFSSDPQISLQDAVVTWFFTNIPFIVLMMSGWKLKHRSKIYNAMNSSEWDLAAGVVSLPIMYSLSAAFTLAVLRHRETFGSTPECNQAARLFFFGTHTLSHSLFVGMAVFYGILLALLFIPVIVKVLFVLWIFWMVRKARKAKNDEERLELKSKNDEERLELKQKNDEERLELEQQHKRAEQLKQTPADADFEADYRWGIIVSILLVIWIAFTELTVAKNHFAPPSGTIWQFGQIFPLIFLALPLLATGKALSKFVREAPKRREESARSGGSRPPRAGFFESAAIILEA